VSGKAANGNDYAGLQAAQQQLMAIQAEQRQNLNVARAEANNLSAQRNILAQAGAMAAMTSQANQGGPVQGRPLVVNPATQAVLGKFGVGQPKTIRSQNQQVTPQNVVINNNYTTNNNVTVPANIG
jgi:predicted exporter